MGLTLPKFGGPFSTVTDLQSKQIRAKHVNYSKNLILSVLENELKDGWVQYLISILKPVLPQNLFSLRIVQVSCPAPVPVAGHQCRLFIALQCDCFPHPLPSHYNRNCSRTMKYSTLCFATLSHLISCSSDLSINQMKTDQCTVLLALHRTKEV